MNTYIFRHNINIIISGKTAILRPSSNWTREIDISENARVLNTGKKIKPLSVPFWRFFQIFFFF